MSWQTNWTWANGPNNVKSCKQFEMRPIICVLTYRSDANLLHNTAMGMQVNIVSYIYHQRYLRFETARHHQERPNRLELDLRDRVGGYSR